MKHVENSSQQVGAFVVDHDFEDGYWVCVEVKKYEHIPDDMVTLTIPSQKYAALEHKGADCKIMEPAKTYICGLKRINIKDLKINGI
ncbi:GyrI-like domain-containing protein [Lysinibacillus sphaericus]|uniref:GyrI-like domain-containing protein n=1 Tax=Lysinibacillus sphaericus TaxID=1421 RepID=UPI002102AF19|nr:effector binding domain-containing protein [Lysinibacillus sp. SDF0037]